MSQRVLLAAVHTAAWFSCGCAGQGLTIGGDAQPLATAETGTQAQFTVVLKTLPTADVIVKFHSLDPGEGDVDKNELTFTTTTWNVAQPVVVTGAQDAVDDGTVTYAIRFDPAASTDANYAGVTAADIQCANGDDDTAAVLVSPATLLETSEAETTATFTVVLATQPSHDVTVGLEVGDADEGVLSVTEIVFEPGATGAGHNHWSSPVQVTVTGVDDNEQDGDETYAITLKAASTDTNYQPGSLAAVTVNVKNTDDDSAGISVVPSSAPGVTTERGGASTFSAALSTQPSHTVEMTVISSAPMEGQPDVAAITFLTTDWNVPRFVVVTGQDDAAQDGTVPYTLTFAVTTTMDTDYQGKVKVVNLENIDDDTAGVSIDAPANLLTTESLGMATFTIVLNSMPTHPVTFPISSSNEDEGVPSPTPVIIPANLWDTPVTVTVTGVNERRVDGDMPYSIIVGKTTSDDPLYRDLGEFTLPAINADNDAVGLTLSFVGADFVTDEAQTLAPQLTVVLDSEPVGEVVVSIQATDPTEATLSDTSLTFDAMTWDTPVVVTGTGVDDDIADGPVPYTVVAQVASATDNAYITIPVISRTLIGSTSDNDAAAVIVGPTTGLATSEDGTEATFTVKLGSQPTADVVIVVSSADTSEVTVDVSNVVFDASNWDREVTVKVTGVQDAIADGPVPFTIKLSPPVSADTVYNAFGGERLVTGTNADDDTAGFVVTPSSGLETTEGGGTARFSISLHTQPVAAVTVSVVSMKPEEGTVSTASVVFTPGAVAAAGANHWSTPIEVVVTGEDDDVYDRNVDYTIHLAVSATDDPVYGLLDPADVSVKNIDDETAGVLLSAASGLSTREVGSNATYSLVLASEPTGDVTVTIVSNDTSEASVSPAMAIFTAATWDEQQVITITGVDDAAADGTAFISITHTAESTGDADYNMIAIGGLSLENLDDDQIGIDVAAAQDLLLYESGAGAGTVNTFEVVLLSQPAADVRVFFASNNTAEATVPAYVDITRAHWNIPVPAQVTSINDEVDDGNVPFEVSILRVESTDAAYNALTTLEVVRGVVVDDDEAGLEVAPDGAEPLVTTEDGGTSASFDVRLTAKPVAEVTVHLASSDNTEGVPRVEHIVFTPANYMNPQKVFVDGLDDNIRDGDVAYSLFVGSSITSDDAKYTAVSVARIALQNQDLDTLGVEIAPLVLQTSEADAGEAEFTVRLKTQPESPVVITLTSTNTREGVLSDTLLTFTDGTWDVLRTVTVTGRQDPMDDGNVTYSIMTATVSADAHYSALDPDDVNVTNVDDDDAGVAVAYDGTRLVTSETPGAPAAMFTVVLATEPTHDVVIDVVSSEPAEGQVSASKLTFSPGGAKQWSTPQTVYVHGVDDAEDDGNQDYSVRLLPITSDDATYHGMDPDDVPVENVNDDTAGITVSSPSGVWHTVIDEAGFTTEYLVVLDTKPVADVTITLHVNDTTEAEVLTAPLIFTPETWSVPRAVRIKGLDDEEDDGDTTFTSYATAASAGDPMYDGERSEDVIVINEDDDDAGIVVSVASLETVEGGTPVTFSVRLSSKPRADVRVPINVTDRTEGEVSRDEVWFTVASWDHEAAVQVTPVDDVAADGSIAYSVAIGAAVSDDPAYAGMTPPDIAVLNRDDDTAGVLVTALSGETSENGNTAVLQIRLTAEPSADVTVALTSSDRTEGDVAPHTLIFTAADYADLQSVVVTGLDDAVGDGSVQYQIITERVVSADPAYHGLDPENVPMVNLDNDNPALVVRDAHGVSLLGPGAPVLATSEGGNASALFVNLATEPVHPVAVLVRAEDASEGELSLSQVIFDAGNWNSSVRIRVRGLQDAVDDGDVAYTVTLTLSTVDRKYKALPTAEVAVVNEDDDTAGVTVSLVTGRNTTERDPLDKVLVAVVLHTEPLEDVIVAVETSNAGEAVASPAALTFQASSSGPVGRTLWSTPQTVTVVGVDDAVDDGDQPVSLRLLPIMSLDPLYAALDPEDVALMNINDDTAGLVVRPLGPGFDHTTREADAGDNGAGLRLTVALATKPAADVEVSVTPSDDGEAGVTVQLFVFERAQWDVPQTVGVVGVDDFALDGDVQYTVTFSAASADALYSGEAVVETFTNMDDEHAALKVINATGLFTSESLDRAEFFVRLAAKPAADVFIPMTSSNEAEGVVTPALLTFTPFTWNLPQIVVVEGVDDDISDGEVRYTVDFGAAVSTDALSAGFETPPIAMVNHDNDVASVRVAPTSLRTYEDPAINMGLPEVFTIVLTARPTADVRVPVHANDREGRVVPKSVLFTPTNWSTPAEVSVYALDDRIADGDTSYFVFTDTPQSADPFYASVATSRVAVVNVDDDVASGAACVLPGCTAAGVVTEAQGGASLVITYVLTSQPFDAVTVSVASNDTSEGQVSTSALVFTPGAWDSPASVTVTGVQDAVDDGDVVFAVVTGAAVSADPAFNGLAMPDVLVTNYDDDVVGLRVAEIPAAVSESDAFASFTVALRTQPEADVTVALSSTDPAVATIDPPHLIFTADSGGQRRGAAALQKAHPWNAERVARIIPVNDFVAGENKTVSLVVGPVTSADGNYNNTATQTTPIVVANDDFVGVAVRVLANNTGSGLPGTFTVALTSQPAGVVSFNLSTTDPVRGGTPHPQQVWFDAANWSAPALVSVMPGPLATAAAYQIRVSGMTSAADPAYNALEMGALPSVGMNGAPLVVPAPLTPPVSPPAGAQVCYFTQIRRPTGATGCEGSGGVAPGGLCQLRSPTGGLCTLSVCTSAGWTDANPTCPGVTSPPTPPISPSSVCASRYEGVCALKEGHAQVTCSGGCTPADCCTACSGYPCPGSAAPKAAFCTPVGCDAAQCCEVQPTRGSDDDDDDGLPTWAVALIVAGAVACCCLLVAAALLCTRKPEKEEGEDGARRVDAEAKEPAPYPSTSSPFPSHQAPMAPTSLVPDHGGSRYIARWSNTRGMYYYYPEGAMGDDDAVWELPPDGYVVTWKGGPDGESMELPDAPLAGADPYAVTPLPTALHNNTPRAASVYQYSNASPAGRNPLDQFQSPVSGARY